MKKISIISFFLLFTVFCHAQECSLILDGYITGSKNERLSNATIFIKEIGRNIIADTSGYFRFADLCPGNYTIVVTHSDYESIESPAKIDSSFRQNFRLSRQSKKLQDIIIVAEKKRELNTVSNVQMKTKELFRQSGRSLGETLKALPGLNSIQTGPTISKPVVHGLHSNRLLILNNGIRQEGQQWGSEHAPEIDPFIATRISVIKGAASVRYGSDAIVGVILVEPALLDSGKDLRGEVNAVAGTNGKALGTSALLAGTIKTNLFSSLNWRLQGTLKKAGNFKTADYYLKNTGATEQDYTGTINFKKNNYRGEIFYSHFFNKIGIFEGSHVGNISDLDSAFARKIPITASYFTYAIDRTYQNVQHDLLKAAASYQFNNGSKLEAVFSFQKNLREEFDIDLPFSTDPAILTKPQISFQIKTTAIDLTYHHKRLGNLTGSIGLTGMTQGNVFRGIRYLVPNFRNYSGGVYAIEQYNKNKWLFEAGLRYDYKWLKTYQINNNTLNKYSNVKDFKNLTATLGSSYRLSNKFSFGANIGTAWRAPSINELYINGIHLSAASYEKGDSTLVSERSYNFSFSAKYETEKFFVEIAPYNNIINGFIYAKPTLKPVTLISGTYPYFNYVQQDVNLSGVDAELRFSPKGDFSFDSKTTIVRGWNKNIHDYLIFIPSDRFSNSIQYNREDIKRLGNFHVNLENVTALRQTRVPPNSDYVAPPKGYSIFNASAGIEIPTKREKILLDLAAYNFTNVSYRDYLNRFRYYADDLGVNLVLRLKLIF